MVAIGDVALHLHRESWGLSPAWCEGFTVVWFFSFCPFRLYIEKLSVPQEKRITLAEYLQQLSRHRNFLWFVCMNLVQVGAAVACYDSEDERWLWLFEVVIQQHEFAKRGRGVSSTHLLLEPPAHAG